MRVRICREQLRRLRALAREIRAAETELRGLVHAQAPQLLALPGCGTLSAAKLIAEVAGVERFADDAKLAMVAGVAPLDASSGRQQRHRLNRKGNRQLNLALHRIAVTQARVHAPAREFLARKQAGGKSRREALRCLKRHLVRVVFKLLRAVMPPPQRVENLSLSNEREMALFPPTRVVDSGDGVDIGATDVPWRDRPRSFIPGAVPRPLEAAGLKESSISAAALET